MNPQYIYLLREREFIKTKENIFKIGKTKQLNNIRFSQYPKDSNLLLQISCNNCDILEKNLINIFKEKFIQRKDIGNEYFEGDDKIMIYEICINIEKEIFEGLVNKKNIKILNEEISEEIIELSDKQCSSELKQNIMESSEFDTILSNIYEDNSDKESLNNSYNNKYNNNYNKDDIQFLSIKKDIYTPNKNIINEDFKPPIGFDYNWDLSKIDKNYKNFIHLSKFMYTNLLTALLENDKNLNVIIDNENNSGIVYKNDIEKYREMTIQDITDKTMEKLKEELIKINKHDQITDVNHIKNGKEIIDKKYENYLKLEDIKKNVSEHISKIYEDKKPEAITIAEKIKEIDQNNNCGF